MCNKPSRPDSCSKLVWPSQLSQPIYTLKTNKSQSSLLFPSYYHRHGVGELDDDDDDDGLMAKMHRTVRA